MITIRNSNNKKSSSLASEQIRRDSSVSYQDGNPKHLLSFRIIITSETVPCMRARHVLMKAGIGVLHFIVNTENIYDADSLIKMTALSVLASSTFE